MFSKYYELPGILSERLFAVLDKDNNGILGEEEFTKGMLKLFSKGKSLNSLAKLIFKIYDFDNDGIICKEDVKLVLSYIALYDINGKYKYYIESQNQLENLLKMIFTKKEMDVNCFLDLVKNINSDIFFSVLTILLIKRPFSNECISFYIEGINKKEEDDLNSNSELKEEKIVKPFLGNLIIFNNIKKILYKNSNPNNVLASNILSIYGINYEKKEISKEGESGEKPIYFEGYIYKILKGKNKKAYFRLINRDLYFYKNREEKNHKGILNLSGVFFKKSEDEIINDEKYYTIASVYKDKQKFYYFDNIENRNIWLEKFKLITEKKNVHDNYEILGIIGKGKYCVVRYGNNIKTEQPVALKIISKKDMNDLDLELTMTEIKILKICQHPYTIKLYDVFETSDYIYIILEYCKGGNLLSYFEKNNFKLSELQVCEIIYKLSLAINYIHSLGIIHRDLKLENIAITDDSDKIDIRLLDFGLSKIIGANQKCQEPYGTITYVAPEIIHGKLCDKSVDIWSLGVITFFLLSGYLPFDDKYSEKEIMIKITKEEIIFKEKAWKDKSSEAKDFVNKLLQKEPSKRINISQVLDHPWLKNIVKD